MLVCMFARMCVMCGVCHRAPHVGMRGVTCDVTSYEPVLDHTAPLPPRPPATAREARSPHGHRGPAVLGVGRLAYRGRAR